MFRTGVEQPSPGLTREVTRPRGPRFGQWVQRTASTSLQASPPSWSTIESKISQDFSKRCAKRAVTCSTRPPTRVMENSDGSWIQRATKLSSGSRQKDNNAALGRAVREL